jgi:hypothetical protein
MSKTLLHQSLIKNIFDIFVDFLIFIHFHYMVTASDKQTTAPSILREVNLAKDK